MSFAFMRNCRPVWNIERPPNTRNCRECGESKPLDQFYPKGETSANGQQKRFFRCRVCMSAKNNQRQKAQRRG